MLDRGLDSLDDLDKPWPVARFTSRGVASLKTMAADKRAFPPETHAQVLNEVAAMSGDENGP